MAAISTWSTTAASNNENSPDGAPEGWAPSAVNAWARETMASVRTWYEDAEWIDFGHTIGFVSGTQFTTAAGDGDTTAIYHVGRRVRETGSIGGPYYGTVTASSHSSQTTVTVSWDSGALDASVTAMAASIISADNPSVNAFASGTVMLFRQTSAPSGWTKDTGLTDDTAIRLTTGTVSSSTGNDSFTTVFGSSINTGSTTLTAAQSGLPAHTHVLNQQNAGVASNAVVGKGDGTGATTSSVPVQNAVAQNASSGHTHTMTMNIDYYDVISATKD